MSGWLDEMLRRYAPLIVAYVDQIHKQQGEQTKMIEQLWSKIGELEQALHLTGQHAEAGVIPLEQQEELKRQMEALRSENAELQLRAQQVEQERDSLKAAKEELESHVTNATQKIEELTTHTQRQSETIQGRNLAQTSVFGAYYQTHD